MTKYPNAIQNGVLAPKTVSVIYSFQYVRCFSPHLGAQEPSLPPFLTPPPNPKSTRA